MPDIQLRFVSADTLADEAIQIFERGWCTHVDSVASDGQLVGARLDGGVQARDPHYATWNRVQLVNITATPKQHADYWSFIAKQIGKPYDTWAIAAFVFDRDWRTPDAWFCDELVARGLEVAGIVRKLAVQTHRLDVRDLYLIVSAIADVDESPKRC
jgi:hypothetical protein